ncbi:M23 family metallopeptidase [Candidatus Neomarinimicrobiota bacterium]
MNYKRIIIALLVSVPLWAQFTYVWPVNTTDQMSSIFGPRYYSSERPYDFHSGLDIGATATTDVKAIADGKVVRKVSNEMWVQLRDGAQLYTVWYKYWHVTDQTAAEIYVSKGDNIAKIQLDHLDIRIYFNPPGYLDPDSPYFGIKPWDRGDLRILSTNPLFYLPYDDTTVSPSDDPNYTVDFTSLNPATDTRGTYLEVTAKVDDRELDLTAIQILMEANHKTTGVDWTTDDLLRGTLEDDGFIDTEYRINCGDWAGNDLDVGKNNDNITIIPMNFEGGLNGTHDFYNLKTRFYLNTTLMPDVENFSAAAMAMDVMGRTVADNGGNWIVHTDFITLLGLCGYPYPPCPEGAPDAPTNLVATANANDNMSIDLT